MFTSKAGVNKQQHKKDLRAKKGQESLKKRWNEDQPTDKVEEDSNEDEDGENSEKPASSR